MTDATATPTAERPWRTALCLVLLVIGLFLAASPTISFSNWKLSETNHGWMEAKAWLHGRLDLEIDAPTAQDLRPRDTAWRDGRVYNVFPPLWTFVSYGSMLLQKAQAQWGDLSELDIANIYTPWYVGLVALPLPLVGFWAFRTVTGRSEWAALLTAYWILGTPLFALLFSCRSGEVNSINHILANTGLMLVAGDVLGRRRVWPSAIGLVVGLWTRQLTILYLPVVAWAAWRDRAQRGRKLAIVLAAAFVGIGASATLNWLKFGSPLDSGYADIYAGRLDDHARRFGEHNAVFDVRYMPRNLQCMNLRLPDVRVADLNVVLDSHYDGVAIWFTSPLVLAGLIFARRWWADPLRRGLMLCSFVVMFGFLCYHTTGSVQQGMFRFAMDFVPIWLVVAASWLVEGRWRWITLGCLGWSALYFHTLCGSIT